ncbi:hypothetical protein GCM10022240_00120 [Microbacterium kribbense]|uniref:NERD domain-containing protein n=1 Tax=Microbacterium kribbense TaxID=433645 RepID=A0ABP7FYA0_9MICO
MTPQPLSDDKRMRLRYAGTCHLCGTALPAGEPAVYERGARRVRCIECAVPAAQPAAQRAASIPAPTADLDSGVAGASARREYDRRKASREKRVRERHPKLGGLILAVSDDPQTTRAWQQGAMGEELLAERLRDLAAPVQVLNDRGIPGTKANIDHIVVAPSGVWVVDAKRYKGKRPALQVDGGIIRPRVESLRIGGRDGTRLVEGVRSQIARVAAALDDPSIEITGALCFLDADWPLLGGGFTVNSVHVAWPRLLVGQIRSAPDRGADIAAMHARLAAAFPVA